MIPYPQMSSEEREAEYQHLLAQFEDLKAQNLKLNMARGKPGEDQLNLTRGIFDIMRSPEDYLSDGIEVRNYGEMTGLPAAKRPFCRSAGLQRRSSLCRRKCQSAAYV